MSQVSIDTRIFGSNGPRLRASGDLQPGQEELVVSGELKGGKSFDALGGSFDFGGGAEAALKLLAGKVDLGPTPPSGAEETLTPLGSFEPPANKRWSEVRISGRANISGAASSSSNVSVKVSGKADLGFEYRGVRAVPAAAGPTKESLQSLLQTGLLPFSRGLQSFGPNQWHEITFDASVGFSAEVAAGKTLTLDSSSGPLEGLLPDDSPEVAAQIKALANAALGLELVESLRIGCGRLPAESSGWVRYRLERTALRKVSFSASLALELIYNREILKRLLSVVLDRVGYPRLRDLAEEIAGKIDPDALSLDNLREKLSTELFDLAKEVLPIDEVTGELSRRAGGLLDLLREIGTRYDELDEEFQSLVDSLLGSAALKEGQGLREALVKLQGLGQESAEQLVQGFTRGRLGELEPLIELLAARGLDDLLLSGASTLKQEIDRLATGAGKLLAIVQDVDAKNLTEVLESATGSSTIRRVIDFIKNAPDNVTDFRALLEEKADEKLRSLIEKLTDRAVGKISKKRLERLREWARKIDDALANVASIDERLSSEIDKMRDRVGFVISFSIDRSTRRAAILDVELDPSVKACRDAFESLSRGNLEEFTDRLPFEQDPGNEDEEPADSPFRFHHFVLTSERSTQLTWIFAPMIGAGSVRTRKAFDSSRIEISQQPSAVRKATYSGGLVLSTGAAKEGLLQSWMGSIWLESTAEGPGPSLLADYNDVKHQIRLATERFDDKPDEATRTGLDLMLEALGFEEGAVSSRVPVEATATRVAAEIALASGQTPDPVDRLFAPLNRTKSQLRKSAPLDEAFLAAAHEWLRSPLIRSQWGKLAQNVVLPAIVRSDAYRERWRNGPWDKPFVFNNGAMSLAVGPTAQSEGSVFAPILQSLAFSRAWASGPLSRLGGSWAQVQNNSGAVKPRQLVELTRAFRRAVRVSTPKLSLWDDPLFQHCLVFTRLRRELGDAGFRPTGVASISWRIDGQDWQPTQRVLIP